LNAGGLPLDSFSKGKIRIFFPLLPLLFLQDLLQLQASLRIGSNRYRETVMSADDQGTTPTQLRSNQPSPALPGLSASGQTVRVEGTSVVRVPFGVRRARRTRPARPERWATVVLPFAAGGSTPPPPQAA
jgi:hypothetical protein